MRLNNQLSTIFIKRVPQQTYHFWVVPIFLRNFSSSDVHFQLLVISPELNHRKSKMVHRRNWFPFRKEITTLVLITMLRPFLFRTIALILTVSSVSGTWRPQWTAAWWWSSSASHSRLPHSPRPHWMSSGPASRSSSPRRDGLGGPGRRRRYAPSWWGRCSPANLGKKVLTDQTDVWWETLIRQM